MVGHPLEEGPGPQSVRILIVDDHAVVRQGLRIFFASEGEFEGVGAARLVHEVRSPGGTEPLTERETEVLRLLALGLANKQIGRELGISEDTVKTHVSRVLAKLGAQSRTQAVLHAMRMGVVEAG